MEMLDTLMAAYRYALEQKRPGLARQVLTVCNEIGVFRADSKMQQRVNHTVDKLKKCGIIKMDGEDDGDGRWVTTENDHKIHINSEGSIDKGNPHVLAAIKTGEKRSAELRSKQQEVDGRARGQVDKAREWRLRNSELATKLNKAALKITNSRKKVKEAEAIIESRKRLFENALIDHPGMAAYSDKSSDEVRDITKQLWDAMEPYKRRELSAEEETRFQDLLNAFTDARSAWAYKELEENQEKALADAQREEKKSLASYNRIVKKNQAEMDEWSEIRNGYVDAIKEEEALILERLPSARRCRTAQDAIDYVSAKHWFGNWDADLNEFQNREGIEAAMPRPARSCYGLARLRDECAVNFVKSMDGMFEKYPMLKGCASELDSTMLRPGVYAQVDPRSNVLTLSTSYFGERGEEALKYAWAKDEKASFHPRGLGYESIMTHELTHSLENKINAGNSGGKRAADIVMERVSKRLYGDDGIDHSGDIRKSVSGYAADNKGTRGNTEYGANTEFLAEAMSEAMSSRSPRKVAKMVQEELEGLMKERGML